MLEIIAVVLREQHGHKSVFVWILWGLLALFGLGRTYYRRRSRSRGD
jgi:hypothetical protein